MLRLENTTPIYEDQPLTNARIEKLSVIKAVVINLVPIAFEIEAKRVIFS